MRDVNGTIIQEPKKPPEKKQGNGIEALFKGLSLYESH